MTNIGLSSNQNGAVPASGKLNLRLAADLDAASTPKEDDQGSIDDAPKLFPTPSYTLQSLRTSKHINTPPFKLATHKLVGEVSCQDVCPSPEPSFRSNLPMLSPTRISQRPGSLSPESMSTRRSWPTWGVRGIPSTPSTLNAAGLCTQRSYSPVRRVAMPAYLSFDSWWTEKGQHMALMVDYCTSTKMCTASMHVCFNTRVTRRYNTSIPLEPWDLHVGAQLDFLGKRITLKKARNQATVDWLDQQGELMIKQCKQLQEELSKYRPVSRGVDIPLQNRHYHNGGKLNLRPLYQQVVALSQALRQHKAVLPELLPGLAGIDQAQLQATGPPDWSPDRKLALEEAERQEQTLRLKLQQEQAAVEAAKHAKRDFLEWLMKIPLAASAAHLDRKGGVFVDPVKAAEELLVQTQAQKKPVVSKARRGSVLALDLNSVPGTPDRQNTPLSDMADRLASAGASRLSSRASAGVASHASVNSTDQHALSMLPSVAQETDDEVEGVQAIPAQSFLLPSHPSLQDGAPGHSTSSIEAV